MKARREGAATMCCGSRQEDGVAANRSCRTARKVGSAGRHGINPQFGKGAPPPTTSTNDDSDEDCDGPGRMDDDR